MGIFTKATTFEFVSMMRIFAQSLNGFKKENTIIGERPLLAHSELGISTSEPD